MDKNGEEVLHDWIHKEYARPVGLLHDEFKVIFNPDQAFDIGWQSGATIIISIRFAPYPYFDLCKSALRRAFDNPYLREFRRARALVKVGDANNWYRSTFTGVGKQLPKKHKKFRVEYITMVRVVDSKTRAEQVIEIINSDAFSATNKALRMLYGEVEG